MIPALPLGATLRVFLLAQVLTALAFSSTSALAFDGISEPAPKDSPKEAPTLPASQVAGHLQFAVSPAGLYVPYGRLGHNLALSDVARTGYGFAGDIGWGLSRFVFLGVEADWSSYGSPQSCEECRLKAYSVGGFLRYHLADGLAGSPFIMYGVGLRSLQLQGTGSLNDETLSVDGKYWAVEWLKLKLGADLYTRHHWGIGGFLQFTGSTIASRPSTWIDSAEKNGAEGRFSLGLRLLFESPSRN
ncbi:MAG: hypothetical protein MK135_06650 [Polyangiaceae bacterium]|nr:hypothetical protein [Polyangiaceae bacterium]